MPGPDRHDGLHPECNQPPGFEIVPDVPVEGIFQAYAAVAPVGQVLATVGEELRMQPAESDLTAAMLRFVKSLR